MSLKKKRMKYKVKRQANFDVLSKSDIKCLNHAVIKVN